MAFLETPHVSIKGLSACAPRIKDCISDIYKWGGVEGFISTTGVKERRRADDSVISSDMCLEAAERLIEELGWHKNEIEALVFVTQTPDYILPSTSCILQDRLGLSKDCLTLDISLGCSGWVYGLSVIASMMQNGTIKKGLFLAGEATVKTVYHNDKSAYPLFGDAGTATALEYDPDSTGMKFILNSDGSGAETIMIRDGGYRNPTSSESFIERDYGDGIFRDRLHTELDGMDVFSFGITKAPKSIKNLLEHYNIEKNDVDLFTFHQANMMMNETIRKKLKLPPEKVPYSIGDFGNTSCASIPLTLVTQEAEKLKSEKLAHIACGFGVGLSWGSVWFETDRIVVPQLIEI